MNRAGRRAMKQGKKKLPVIALPLPRKQNGQLGRVVKVR